MPCNKAVPGSDCVRRRHRFPHDSRRRICLQSNPNATRTSSPRRLTPLTCTSQPEPPREPAAFADVVLLGDVPHADNGPLRLRGEPKGCTSYLRGHLIMPLLQLSPLPLTRSRHALEQVQVPPFRAWVSRSPASAVVPRPAGCDSICRAPSPDLALAEWLGKLTKCR